MKPEHSDSVSLLQLESMVKPSEFHVDGKQERSDPQTRCQQVYQLQLRVYAAAESQFSESQSETC